MSSKKPRVGTDSPSTSSSYLPLRKSNSRGSAASQSTTSLTDRESLTQALDQIHSTASRSSTLTTFNEFTTPPSSSSGAEGKGIASELQGGLSGLYSRFRASVSGVRDVVGSAGLASEDADGDGDEEGEEEDNGDNGNALPTPVATPKTSVWAPATKPFFHSPKYAHSFPATSKVDVESPTNLLSPLSNAIGTGPSNEAGQVSPHTRPTLASLPTAMKVAQVIPSTAVEPALIPVNVSAVSEQGLQNLDNTDSGHKTPRISSHLARAAFAEDHAIEKQHKHQSAPYPDQGRGNVDVGNSNGFSSYGSQESNIASKPASITKKPSRKPSNVLERSDQAKEPSANLSYESQRGYEPSQTSMQEPATPSPQPSSISVTRSSRLPDFRISRASSTETTGVYLSNFPSDAMSSHDEVSENDSVPAENGVEKKAVVIAQASTNPQNTNAVFSQIRSRVLSKEYWMRDENARDCFFCGDAFSTFRRKHHCRTCGQIFDSKCTSLISGGSFGQAGSVRVCKPCEGIINGYDDSSEFSDDGSVMGTGLRARHGSSGANETASGNSVGANRLSNNKEIEAFRQHPHNLVPTMSISATRREGENSGRRSAVLEIDSERRLIRPSSSRSLKSSLSSRPHSSTHKRHYSRHQIQRSFKPVNEETAPFQRNPDDDTSRGGRLPAFHSDNIIDPDLAAFLSDEDSSGSEQMSVMTILNGDGLSKSLENERHGLSGLLSSSKKGRSRIGDKSSGGATVYSRDADNVSLNSAKMASQARSKRRNLSISSNMHLRPSPRAYRFSTATPAVSSHLHESLSSSTLEQSGSSGLRMMRSSSMKGADAPAVELNNASIQHVRKLLRQLLQDSHINNLSNWEKALMPILLQATDDVNPDVQRGDDIDIRHYVKLKKIPGGRPGDTSYVSGLVFTKNLALKSMPRNISYPDILILTFPIEYARYQQHFMSLEPVIRQEREYLQNLVHRIAALHPQLLLVQRNISGLALEFLQEANIATAYNVKASVLEAVSRCTQTRIISSIDKLAIKPVHAGKCASFYLKTYVYGGRKKTYMYLAGCQKELGCTIALRGGNNEVLGKIKRITEFMVYVVYNLKLETSLMRDEFALIPSCTGAGSLSPDKESARLTNSGQSHERDASANAEKGASNKPGEENRRVIQASADMSNAEALSRNQAYFPLPHNAVTSMSEETEMPEDIPMPTFYGDMVEKHKTKILSASPFVKFMQPYLLMRSREQERRLVYLKRLRDQDVEEEQKKHEDTKPQKFVLIKPEMIHENIKGTSKKVREVLHAVHDAEFDKALHSYRTQKKQWEAYISGNINLFDPYAHQNIAVLYSVVCTVTTVPCSGPDLLALGFYNEHEVDADFEADCTLGQYVEDLCLGANTVCTVNSCERKMFEHHRLYVHGDAQLTVFVEHYPCKLRGLQDSILMWSTCRICGSDTQVLPMSENTWKYSFGKYLELSFWSSELHPRAGVCPHDIHRNHLRYFGFKDIALRIQYDPINLLEIIVPRARITWKVVNDLRLRNDIFMKAEERLNKFMLSVKARIKSIKVESVIPEKAAACKEEIDRLMKRASDEHHALIQKLQEKYMDSKYYEVIPLNRAIRATQEKVAEWDTAFGDFDRNFFPSEKDIRRLATLQLKKMFLDRDDSVTSLTSNNEGTSTPISEGELEEKSFAEEPAFLDPQTRRMSLEKAHDMLTSVVEEDSAPAVEVDRHKSAPPTAIPGMNTSDDLTLLPAQDHEDVRHLDLAVASCFPSRLPDSQAVPEPETRPVSPTTARDKHTDPTLQPTSMITEPVADGPTGLPLIRESAVSLNPPASGIPRLSDLGVQKAAINPIPPLNRTQSQPYHSRKEKANSGSSSVAFLPQPSSSSNHTKRLSDPLNSDTHTRLTEKKLSDRLGIAAAKPSGVATHSMIPRSIASRRKESRVSALAKHFEQLSREFEKERSRERRQRAAKSRQARAYPMASSKPIVEVYRNVHEAVEEREPSDEDSLEIKPSHEELQESTSTADGMALNDESSTAGDGFHAENTVAEETAAEDTVADTETDDNTHVDSHTGSDGENEATRSDEENLLDDIPDLRESNGVLSQREEQLDLKLELPKHEKTSLMKMLTNFWAERSASGWQPLEYPLNATDHVFADSDIIVREDEPSSLIAFTLGSEDYQTKLQKIQEKSGGLKGRHDRSHLQDPLLDTDEQMEVEQSLLRSTGTHLKYQFQEGSAKMLCKVFYAEQFDAVRRKCGVAERIVESLSRCLKWDSKGGKTKSVFLKTLDDRLVLKSLSPIETQAFLRFAPAYFRIMSEALFHALPSVIAKMLGFYQIVIKNPVTGVEFNWFLLVMENLFYDRSPTRIFDLKGSMRNRRIQSTGEQNEVLLDENMVEFICESPLFAREHSKKLLRASVYNDTLFLSRQNVMDYSLMIAIDEDRKELVVGIIDCIRTYTWDKMLESWMKDRGKNRPTVTSPREYKSRFRGAMGRYVLQAPDCWHQFQALQTEPRPIQFDDRTFSQDMEFEQVVGM